MRAVACRVLFAWALVLFCCTCSLAGDGASTKKAGSYHTLPDRLVSYCKVWFAELTSQKVWRDPAASLKLGPKIVLLSLGYLAAGLLCAGTYLVLVCPAKREQGAILLLFVPIALTGGFVMQDVLTKLAVPLLPTKAEADDAVQSPARSPEESARWQQAWKHYEHGDWFFNRERYEEAIEQYTTALATHNGHYRSYYMRGLTYQTLGKNKQALEDYTASIKFGPKWAPSWQNRAVLFYEAGYYDRAFVDATTAYNLFSAAGHIDDTLAVNDLIASIKRKQGSKRGK